MTGDGEHLHLSPNVMAKAVAQAEGEIKSLIVELEELMEITDPDTPVGKEVRVYHRHLIQAAQEVAHLEEEDK